MATEMDHVKHQLGQLATQTTGDLQKLTQLVLRAVKELEKKSGRPPRGPKTAD